MYQHATGWCQAQANLLGLKDEMAAYTVANELDTTLFCLDNDLLSERKEDDDDWTLHTTASSSSISSEPDIPSSKTTQCTSRNPPFTDYVISQKVLYEVETRIGLQD
jgi:hypothetical protein